jgi:acyl-CoA reductase-like NAD-dependent aldehyde dehydrogenase
MIERRCLYLDGRWVEPIDGRVTDVIYPFTEEPIGQAALAGPADVDRAVRAARTAFEEGPWHGRRLRSGLPSCAMRPRVLRRGRTSFRG